MELVNFLKPGNIQTPQRSTPEQLELVNFLKPGSIHIS